MPHHAQCLVRVGFVGIGLAIGIWGQPVLKKPALPGIQDNSFLVEEAYNQERGVVQNISMLQRGWNDKSWVYSFTQEWPAPRNWRHQFSYTLVATHAGEYPGSGMGWGDSALNYRYQIKGDGESRVAVANRVSLLVPSGDFRLGRGAGGPGLQNNLAVSTVLHPRWIAHGNAGVTYVYKGETAEGVRGSTWGYSFAEGVNYVVTPRLHLLLEATQSRYQPVEHLDGLEWERELIVSPGIRWAHNYNGLQIVPGLAFPIEFEHPSDIGVIVYLSFEFPFTRGR